MKSETTLWEIWCF